LKNSLLSALRLKKENPRTLEVIKKKLIRAVGKEAAGEYLKDIKDIMNAGRQTWKQAGYSLTSPRVCWGSNTEFKDASSLTMENPPSLPQVPPPLTSAKNEHSLPNIEDKKVAET